MPKQKKRNNKRYFKTTHHSGNSAVTSGKSRMTLSQIILFLFIFLLPTQLGKHFFFPFSYLSGVRVDYLAPTLYLTDLLVAALVLFNIKHLVSFFKQNKILVFVLLLLGAHTLFAISWEVALYRYVKILEIILVFALFKNKVFDFKPIASGFFWGTLFQTILVILQFVNKHALQGFFYFFGERDVALSMPGIAKAAIGGIEFLRPYGTFSHPNSMAGFYLLLYTFFLTNKKPQANPFVKNSVLFLSSFLILFSFSKVAVLAYILINIVYLLKKADFSCIPCLISRLALFAFFALFIFSSKTDPLSLKKRIDLFSVAWQTFLAHPFSGVGLGNSLIAQSKSALPYLIVSPQPVHNIFLLFLAETGIIAGALTLFFLIKYAVARLKNFSFFLCLLAVFVSGMFDHYWFTLQQNTLLLGVVFGLL
ncbi:O-antigen ligase family protein [Candidatus Roizmanbacteria bacterium]|nr:O-antigen ligase family protein [Candidatus Roizmanbacteria bacterium]